MDEKRSAPRHKVLKGGAIEFGGGVISCTVKNLAQAGAALEVASPVGIPDSFTLVIGADEARFVCQVIWRKEKRIGVEFR